MSTLSERPDRSPTSAAQESQLGHPGTSSQSTAIELPTQPLRETLLLYRAAVAWSVVFSSLMIIEYYTNAMATMFFAMPQFIDANSENDMPTKQKEPEWIWMFLFGFLNIIGCIVGSVFNGWFSEAYGQKRSAVLGLVLLDGFILMGWFLPDLRNLCIANTFIGISFGIFSTLGITYAADVCPPRVRSYLLAYANITHILGQLLATLVILSCHGFSSTLAYRLPWVLTLVPGISLLAVCWAPESPTWLVRKNDLKKARESLVRLMQNETTIEINARLIVIMEKNDEEKKIAKRVSFRDCFTGQNLRFTLLTCLVSITNWASGNAMIGHAVYFLRTTGFDYNVAFLVPFGQSVLGILSTMFAWIIIDRAERRTVLLWGMAACTVMLIVIGLVGLALQDPHPMPVPSLETMIEEAGFSVPPAAYGVLALTLLYSIVRNLSVGPITQILYTEIPTTRLRQKTTALSRNTGFVTGLINTVALPAMLSPTKWNLSAKAAFAFAALSVICTIVCWAFLDESKGKEREEAQRLAQEVAEYT